MLNRDTSMSFEVFPPKKNDEFDNCYNILDSLAKLNPDFISVTYGAGGSRSKKTVEIASYIQNTLKIDAMAHMTCVGSTEEDILEVTRDLEANGVYAGTPAKKIGSFDDFVQKCSGSPEGCRICRSEAHRFPRRNRRKPRPLSPACRDLP